MHLLKPMSLEYVSHTLPLLEGVQRAMNAFANLPLIRLFILLFLTSILTLLISHSFCVAHTRGN